MTSDGGRFYLIYRDLQELANGTDVGAVSLEGDGRNRPD